MATAEGTALAARFRAALEAIDGVLHEAASLDDAREVVRGLVGDAPVARWRDAALDGVATAEADPVEAEVSLVVADVGVAATGQVGLVHGPGRPRAAALLPPRQVVLLPAVELVAELAEALAGFYGGGRRPPGSLVLVAGPSRTADIEQRVIRGMHAPKTLDVVLHG